MSLSLLRAAASNPAATVGPMRVVGTVSTAAQLATSSLASNASPGREMDWKSNGDQAVFVLVIIVMTSVYIGIRKLSLSLARDHRLLSPMIDAYEPLPYLSSVFGVPRMVMDNRGRYQRLNEAHGSSWAGYDRLCVNHTTAKHDASYAGEEVTLTAVKKSGEARERIEESPSTASTSSSQIHAVELAACAKVARRAIEDSSLHNKSYKKPASLAAINIAAATGYRRSKLGAGSDQPVAVMLPSSTQTDSPRLNHRPGFLPQLQIRSPSHTSYSSALSPLSSSIRLRSPMLLSLEEGTRGTSVSEKVFSPPSLSFSHKPHRMTSPKSPRSPRYAQRSPRSPRSPLQARLSPDGTAAQIFSVKKRSCTRDEGFDTDLGTGVTKEDGEKSTPFSFE